MPLTSHQAHVIALQALVLLVHGGHLAPGVRQGLHQLGDMGMGVDVGGVGGVNGVVQPRSAPPGRKWTLWAPAW